MDWSFFWSTEQNETTNKKTNKYVSYGIKVNTQSHTHTYWETKWCQISEQIETYIYSRSEWFIFFGWLRRFPDIVNEQANELFYERSYIPSGMRFSDFTLSVYSICTRWTLSHQQNRKEETAIATKQSAPARGVLIAIQIGKQSLRIITIINESKRTVREWMSEWESEGGTERERERWNAHKKKHKTMQR